jgi:1-acyl-sn-glycerol-3-phosphate acyltransferase
MSKSESSEMGRPRRPAARRAPAPANATPGSESDLDHDANDPAAQPSKRIHARRSKLDSEPPSEPRAARPVAVRARAGALATPPSNEAGTAAERGSDVAADPPRAAAPATSTRESEPDLAVEFESERDMEIAVDEPDPSEDEQRGAADVAGQPDSELAEWTSPMRLHSDAAAADSYEDPDKTTLALRRRSSSALRLRTEEVDEFGLDGVYEAKLRPFFEGMCRNYLHVQVQGAHNIPARGRALLVSNHSRALSWDGIVLRTALRQDHEAHRELRWLVEDEQFHAPFLGTFVNRLGAVRACQENAERLLARDELVAVFPEGVKVADKRYQDRYKLLRFGRGGYVKLALRTGAPVIPVAIVGVDEPSPLTAKSRTLSKWLGRPLFALSPALPKLGALGVPPLPSRWRIAIGEPVREIARQDSDALRDDGLIHELNECVRSAIQGLIDQGLRGEH